MFVILALCAFLPHSSVGYKQPLNVLLIVLDDLRPELPGFNRTWLQTPNINSIAAQGTRFSRAYIQAPQCCPTRNSFLTGMRPDYTRVFTNGDLKGAPANATITYFRQAMPNGADIITLPQFFKKNNYYVTGAGKVFHPGEGIEDADAGEAAISYSDPYYFCLMGWNGAWVAPTNATKEKYPFAEGCVMSAECASCLEKAGTLNASAQFGNATSESDCDDDCYNDGNVATEIIRRMNKMNEAHKSCATQANPLYCNNGIAKPFFISYGNRNPHLPWFAPRKYFDAVRNATPTNERVAYHTSPPKNALLRGDPYDNFEFWLMNDLKPIKQMVDGFPEVPPYYHNKLRTGYWASLGYTDAQIGRVLDTLKSIGHAEDTIIALVGDHGYGLGELGNWGKYTLMEQGTRAALMISVPGQPNPGSVSNSLSEFVDIYPTLVDAALSLKAPDTVQGVSLLPNIMNSSAPGRPRAFSQYPAVHRVVDNNASIFGAAMRTEDYRYVCWSLYDFTRFRPTLTDCVGEELYSYENLQPDDVNHFDLVNLAEEDNYKNVKEQMLKELQEYWP
eukprot:m.82609 g.82609  ORF g.82609 m.82609 type:complete len:561 (+) comp12878_c0_seq1:167-1849(+)